MGFPVKALNKEQMEIILCDNRYILILAGAGSGKTRTLTYRIAYLINEKGVNPANILAVTFTNKAAREMIERLENLLGKKIDNLWIGTFHSIFARILRIESKYIPFNRNFTIYDTDDQIGAIKKVMSIINLPQQLYSPKLFQVGISRAKNKLLSLKEMEEEGKDDIAKLLPSVYNEYNKFLQDNNAVDFDDLLILPIKLFDNHPNILRKYQKKFKNIFIDEYQDINKAQNTLIKKLIVGSNTLCVVGDEDQSIYKWRGADINNILNFENEYNGTKVYRLEENFRSNNFILKGANALVMNNNERLGKNLWTNKKDGDPIIIIEADDEVDEAKKIVENIHAEMFSKKRSFRDIAILYRTNAQSRAIEDELRKNAISYNLIGGTKFYERKEIKDILAYLKVIVNTRDSVSVKRIVNFPLRGIGDTTIGKIEKYIENMDISLLEGMGRVHEINTISTGMANRVIEFYQLIDKYRNLSQQISPAELTSALTHETGIISYLKNEYDQYESESRLDNVYELFNTMDNFSREKKASGYDNLSDFLEEVSLLSEIDSFDDKKNSVTLMTLHSAKGLEFPVIFITGLEMGLCPLQRNSSDKSELEEERRLLYVGMTRAKENLYLSYARNRRKYNNISQSLPSLFLDEIPSAYTKIRLICKDNSILTAKSRRKERRKKILAYFHRDEYSQIEEQPFNIGSFVYHETFGKGKIIDLEGCGDKMKISVIFDGNIEKKLIARYANLTLLEIKE
jgi:DNA helicase-2/ATP-dependent DNA helicase PcrA